MELWDVFSIINTGWLHHPAFKKRCVSSCERGFADNLGEESQVAAPSRDSSATCLCLSLRNEERKLWALPSRNLSLFWAGHAGMGSLGARTSFPERSAQPNPKMLLWELICRFLSCAGFSGVTHLGATSPCCARAAGLAGPSGAGTSRCVITG